MIDVYIISAENLPSADLNGKSDPFVNIKGVSEKKTYFFHKTDIIFKTLDPVWDSDCTKPYQVPFVCCSELVFDIYDYDKIGFNDYLGTARLKLTTSNNGQKVKLPIEVKKKTKGDPNLYVMYKFPTTEFPNAQFMKDSQNFIYSYLSFDPPLQNASGASPVTPAYYLYRKSSQKFFLFSSANSLDTKSRYVDVFSNDVYRGVNDWVNVRRFCMKEMRKDDDVVIQLDGTGYKGMVTIHFVVLREKEKKETIVKNVCGHIYSKSINVDFSEQQISPIFFPFYLNVTDGVPTFMDYCPPTLLGLNQSLIRIGKAIYKNSDYWTRYTISKGCTTSLSEAAEIYNDVQLGNFITIALGWDTNTDLDGSIYCYGKNSKGEYQCIDICYYGKKSIFKNAIQHNGDNRTGAGSGDDETIFISLNQIPINVEFMIVGITSYENMPMNKVKGGFLRVIDRASKKEIMFLPLSNQEKKTGLLFAIFKRVNDDSWDLYPVIQYFQDGKNPNGANGYFLSMLNDPCSLETLLNYG